MKTKQLQKLVEKKEKEITELLIQWCEARIKETKEITNGYYHKKIKELLTQLK